MSLILIVLAIICLVFGVSALLKGALLFGLILVAVGVFLGGYGRNGLR